MLGGHGGCVVVIVRRHQCQARIRRDEGHGVPHRSIEWIRGTNSFRTSYWSPGHVVAVTVKADEGYGLVEAAGRHGDGDCGVGVVVVAWMLRDREAEKDGQ